MVDHKLHSDEDREALAKDSMLKWAEHNPHEPFEWKELVQIGDRVAYEQKSRYDIAAAVHRQRKFANMVIASALRSTAYSAVKISGITKSEAQTGTSSDPNLWPDLVGWLHRYSCKLP